MPRNCLTSVPDRSLNAEIASQLADMSANIVPTPEAAQHPTLLLLKTSNWS
ncbi:hypothetical protein AVDCRST_MAG94-4036 [uncultured Leptolyngbya sp.]|uniref:Uncharacterized protein n=1 Tax=uncultured Leptolyngbya sp. TaxID=332963 RepID=A0A6J4MY39_9CYAN|nr:hypothetical protein AVDCRST_MAG94-4036 [uncultured Leptolyngbya sp.]